MGNLTITDVAKHAGVSIATVSRVMNGRVKVNPHLVARVKKSMDELDFTPNINARNIRSSKSDTIAFIIPMARNPFFAEILEGAIVSASDLGLKLIVFSGNGSMERDKNNLYAASKCYIDGLIYCPIYGINSDEVVSILPRNTPLVVASRRGTIPNVPHIYQNNVQGGYIATKYLIRLGRKNIAFFAGIWENAIENVDDFLELLKCEKRGVYTSVDRFAGYLQALEEADITFDKSLVTLTGFDFESGYDKTKEFLSKVTDFDAAIYGNDLVAAGGLNVLKKQNITVPNDVSVIGYDDGLVAPITMPSLTSVHQQPYLIGYNSVKMLVDVINKKTVEDQILDTTLSIRNSTAVKL